MRVCPECNGSTDQEVCPNDGRPTVDADKLKVPARVDSFVGLTIAGKYTIEERLGRGGYGAVYRARHVETSGEVAIKLVRADLVDDEMVIRRFYIEAQNTHKLHHPNTVRVSDFGRTPEGILYLVMEYVKGVPLSKVIKKEAPLAPERAVRIAIQILKALGEAHANSLVHRDIKPENIMLIDQFGEPDFVKVLDFGISRALDSTGASTQGLLGTPRYMAPEQWRSLPVDGRTDMYAAGCILYEMLAGRLPFDAPEGRGAEVAVGYMTAHVARPPVPISTLVSEEQVPADLASCLMQMLAKKKDDRPPNVYALLKHLEHIQRNHQLSAKPTRQVGGIAPPPGAAPGPPSDTQTLDGELIEITGMSQRDVGHSDLSTELSGPPRLSNTSGRWKLFAAVATVVIAVGAFLAFGGDDPKLTETANAKTGKSRTVETDAAAKETSGSEAGKAEGNAAGSGQAAPGAATAGSGRGQESPAVAPASEPATVLLKTDPVGAAVKTKGGILLGAATADGIRVTNPPLEQGEEVILSMAGYEDKTAKIGFPPPGVVRELAVRLTAIPKLRFNLPQGIRVSIKETSSDLGISPTEYVLHATDLTKLRSDRRLTLVFSQDGYVAQELVVDERRIAGDSESISAVLVRTKRATSPRKKKQPTRRKKKKLPDWK